MLGLRRFVAITEFRLQIIERWTVQPPDEMVVRAIPPPVEAVLSEEHGALVATITIDGRTLACSKALRTVVPGST